MSINPLEKYRELDPKLVEQYQNLVGLAYSDGALPAKFKLLIALAIDVAEGALEGAVVLGKRALAAGASKDEILEALRIAYQIGGTKALFCSAQLVKVIF